MKQVETCLTGLCGFVNPGTLHTSLFDSDVRSLPPVSKAGTEDEDIVRQ